MPWACPAQADRDNKATLFSPGDTIARYEILEPLGRGGMGIVYRARDPNLNRDVALKFLPPDLVLDSEANERFITEAQAASRLNHPNICTIYEISEWKDGHLFIAMALYEGQTLRRLLAQSDGRLSVEQALDLAFQIAGGLSAAHEKGIVHRDIKPANVIIDSRGRAVILDFGLAKLSGAVTLTRLGSTLGTVAYMSPEQATGDGIDPAADVWALGVVLYEMLTGRQPFQGEYDQAMIYNILNSEPQPASKLNPELSTEIESILDRSLAKDPSQRYPTAGEFLVEIGSLKDGNRIPATWESGGATALPSEQSVRHMTRWLLGGLFAVAAVVALSFLMIKSGNENDPIDSIAVLPLADLSGTTGQEYFADGMTDALITELSKISALRVISRQSVMRFKNSSLPLKGIADELDVEAVVAGTVIRSGEQVRISAQLISPETEENLWADSFDRGMENILSLHADVARAIANQIEVTVTPAEQVRLTVERTVNPDAYEEYLKGQALYVRLSAENFDNALRYYERALEIDPEFTLAYAAIAKVWQAYGLWGGVPPGEANAKAFDAVRQAVALGDTLAETMHNLGLHEYLFNYNWDSSERAFRRAIELDPNFAESRLMYADLLGCIGRFDEALAQVERGLEIDPISPLSLGLKAWVLLQADRYAEAVEQHLETLQTDPNFPLAHRGLWALYHRRGDSLTALAEAISFYRAQELPEVAEELEAGLEDHSYAASMAAAAERALRVAQNRYVPAMHIARLYTYAGNRERALDMLEAAYEERFPSMPALGTDPHWDDLRSESRFVNLMLRLGLPSTSADRIE